MPIFVCYLRKEVFSPLARYLLIDPLGAPDPIEAIKYLMEEKVLVRKVLEQSLGDKSKVSAILNRKRELSKKMIRSLHETFGIPYEILMAG
jgi:HTH-type transcriptional regulator/antitoxin HigA